MQVTKNDLFIESKETIFKKFHKAQRLETILLVLSSIGLMGYAYFIITNFSWVNSRFSILVPIFHFLFFLSPYILLFFYKHRTIDQIYTKRVGQHLTKDIASLFQKSLDENFTSKETKPTLFIVSRTKLGAFATRSLTITFIKKLNCIAMSEDIFKYLNLQELRAVLAHEIGHFKYYISNIRKLKYIPFLFTSLTVYIVIVYLLPMSLFLTLPIYLLSYILLKKIWTKSNVQNMEYLSDLYASCKYGKLSHINALIRLYQSKNKNWIITLEIAKLIHKSTNIPLEEFDSLKWRITEKVGKKMHDETFLKNQIYQHLTNIVNKEKYEDLSTDALKERNEALEEYFEKDEIKTFMGYKVHNWKDIDKHRYDGRIDEIEYPGLIEAIKRDPKRQLFRSKGDNILSMKDATHPALRQRILFVHENCDNLNRVS